MATVLVVLAIGGAVAAHHAMPEMSGMVATVACLAVLAGAVTVAVAATVLRPLWRPLVLSAPPEVPVVAPWREPARAGPLHLTLQVLRR